MTKYWNKLSEVLTYPLISSIYYLTKTNHTKNYYSYSIHTIKINLADNYTNPTNKHKPNLKKSNNL